MNLPENMTLQATLESRKPTPTTDTREKYEWVGRVFILLAVVVSPWLYGSFYFSAQFFIALCSLVGIAFLWFESGVSERRSLILPYLMLPLLFGIALALLQIVPLPEWAEGLLGKQKELYPLLTGDPAVAPSISMSRSDTWDQIGLLVIAFSALCLGCRYFRKSEHIKLLLATITINGVAIALFGMVQSLTTEGNGTIFWTVPLLKGGEPFGPYVNRNNAAGYLLICLGAAIGLSAINLARPQRGPKSLGTKDLPFWTQFNNHFLRFIADLDAPKVATLIAPIVISAGIISSLSRGGVLSMLVGAAATLLLYGLARRPSFSAFIFIPSFGLAILLAFWLGMGDQLMNRMEDINTVDVANQSDFRIQHWIETWPATSEFGVLGSGVGAYDEVHRLYNSGATQAVFRYAENQFYQALVELGWPGLILLLTAWSLTIYFSLFMLFKGVSASTVGIGVAGLFTSVSVAVASIFDFGLYIPANMLLMSLFCGFLAYHAQSLSTRLKKTNWLRFETPNSVAQLLLLVTFAALATFALDFYRKWQIQSAVREYPIRTFNVNYPPLSEVDRLIEEIQPLVQSTRYAEGVDYMARLLIHRSRVQAFNAIQNEDQTLDPEQIWQRTSLDLIQENAWGMLRDGEMFAAAEFLKSPFIVENLPWARQYLLESRKIDPMESQTHLRLGQVNALVGTKRLASNDMERAIMLAPNKTDLKFLAGFYYLQTGNQSAAAKHFKDLLDIDPRQFKSVMSVIFGKSNRNVAAIAPMTVVREIMPDDPELLYRLAKRWLPLSSPARRAALDRADELLQNLSASDRKLLLIKAEIKYEKQEFDDALEQFQYCLDSNPNDYATHYRVADILWKLGDLETAESKLEYVLRMGDNGSLKVKCEKLLTKIRAELKNLKETAN
jgi:tetratricopeptide (TPR) repeat protein